MNRYTNLKVNDSIRIKSNSETIFQFLTEAEKLGQWWPVAADSEPFEGGRLQFHWQNSSATETAYESFIPNQHIAFPFGSEYVDLTIVEEDDGCILSVSHSRITIRETSFDLLIHIAQSWTFLLLNIKSVIEYGIDFRSAQV